MEKLFREGYQIAAEISGFDSLLAACRESVDQAARHWPDLEAWWRKSREDFGAG
jgi:hypothetical protein